MTKDKKDGPAAGSDLEIRALPGKPGHSYTVKTSTPNLYVRISPKGRKVFVYRYTHRAAGESAAERLIPLGEHPKPYTLAKANAEAAKLNAVRIGGGDPAKEHSNAKARQEREAADLASAKAEAESSRVAAEHEAARIAGRLTVTALFERWHKVQASKRKDGGAEIRRAMEKDVLPLIGHVYAEDARKVHIRQVLDAALDQDRPRGPAPRFAKVLLQYLRQMFLFAAEYEIVTADPTFGLKKRNLGGKDKARDRDLSETEIRQLATQLPNACLPLRTQASVWVMLATLVRVGELSLAKREHVDLEAKTWFIPADRRGIKSDRDHTVYLSDFAARHVARLMELNTASEWLIPGEARGKKKNMDLPIHVQTLQKSFSDRQRTDHSIKKRTPHSLALLLSGGPWTAHDLRRTGATIMGELGVLPHVIEKCLNHALTDEVQRIYNRSRLERQREEAFTLLGERLDLLTTDRHDSVVT